MRTLARPLALFVALAAVAGCAAMQMTLAQELAWEQWKRCDNFTTVSLKEVRVDGQIWVTYYSRGEYDRWVECIRKAREEQSGRVGIVAAPPAIGTTPLVGAGPASAHNHSVLRHLFGSVAPSGRIGGSRLKDVERSSGWLTEKKLSTASRSMSCEPDSDGFCTGGAI